ncbi:PREDICTED: muscarinic acetylcholine receptor M1-like [Acropora digitifera]|uniref:muscarinic acetylcholine receptor M1-like n=1 Tax=Acropora digitifera TaxID=70779 RepID=UPI00077B152F|nr:PREDICTED: muscarinic acetylcholine receptor M1-like [Acropora digitifera]
MALTASISCATVPPPTGLSYFTASVSVFLTLITVPGNFLICIVIVKDPFRNLKTPFHYLVLSLAATDLLVGSFMDPASAVFHFGEALQSKVVDVKIIHFSYFILSTASILTLAALTAERYVAVTSPLKYKTTVTPKRAIITSLLIWIAALGFSFIYFKLGFIFYSFIFANTAVICTFAVLLFVHMRIVRRLRERAKYWRDRRANDSTESGKLENKIKTKETKRESRAVKALMIILLAFFVSFTPACIMIYLLNFCSNCSCLFIHWLRDLQYLIVVSNSGINPYLYAWRIPQFKRALFKLMHIRRTTRNFDISMSTSQEPEQPLQGYLSKNAC